MKSTDNAGHTGEEAICSFVIDQTIPDTLITMGPNSPMMLDEMAGFVFACPGETRCEYMYSFDGADYKPVETPSFRCKGLGYHKCVAGPVKAGMHTMMVYAVDAAGNADPTPAAFSFSVFDEVGYQVCVCPTSSLPSRGPMCNRSCVIMPRSVRLSISL